MLPTFLRLPSPVPRKATVKSPVLVAVTLVRRAGKVRTGAAVMGSSPPRGVLTSRPQNCSPKHKYLGLEAKGGKVNGEWGWWRRATLFDQVSE